MKVRICLLASAMSVIAFPAWAINKCTVNGKVVYQDAPCLDAKKVDISGAGKADPNSEGTAYWKREAERQSREKSEQDARDAHHQKVQAAIYGKRVFRGMTSAEVVRSWGNPTKINTSIGSYGKHEQWVYDRGDFKAQYVYIENGVVTGMQSPE